MSLKIILHGGVLTAGVFQNSRIKASKRYTIEPHKFKQNTTWRVFSKGR